MAHSLDYREEVVRAHAECGSSAEVAESHHCSESWVRRMTQQMRETGSVAPKSTARLVDQRTYTDKDEAKIRRLITRQPDATLAEVAEAIGKPASLATMCRTLQRLDLPRKKKSTHAAERDRPDVAMKRAAWFGRFADRRVVDLVFLDEFGANTKMQRTHGRAAPGERVVATVPHGHYKTISTIAALSTKGVIASASFDGGTTAAKFVEFIATDLIPTLRRGQVVVLDNLAAHNDRRVDALLAAAGCEVIRLPPYSPDLNPIENAISKIKTMLRKLAKRTVPGLFAGIVEGLASITVADAKAFIKHCGYATKRSKPL